MGGAHRVALLPQLQQRGRRVVGEDVEVHVVRDPRVTLQYGSIEKYNSSTAALKSTIAVRQH